MTEPNTTWAQPEGTTPEPAAAVPVAPVSPTDRPRKQGGGLTNALLVVAALVAVGGVTFAVGRATAPASAASGVSSGLATGRQGFAPGGSFDPGTMPGGGLGPGGDRTMSISGTVKSLDGSTLVITTEDGTETAIDVSGTTYHSQAAASAADVTAGVTVSVAVTGFGGSGRPGASSAPDASAAPASRTITATDVTITSE